MNRVRIGVIGAGNIARNYHLPPVHALPNAELVAVADLDESLRLKAQKQFGFRDAYTDYRRILDRDDIHAIMLLTRVNTHTEIIPAALDAGKHVFTQKPFALTNENAEFLAQAARRTGNRLVCSFMHRYFPHTQGARRILQEGKIGRLEMVRHRNCIGLRQRRPLVGWRPRHWDTRYRRHPVSHRTRRCQSTGHDGSISHQCKPADRPHHQPPQ